MNKELYDLLLEVEKIIKLYEEIPNIKDLPRHHSVAMSSVIFENLSIKYDLYTKSIHKKETDK